ncbi:response regulator transcription factor [Bacteroides propionicifaciens]|jgi:DNA-binding response OmpR family regulator|uniref:response regulator transcription factor n=1 Tax=Bacteroides propionicifaciens TaxID=392838 RepID=UPI0003673F63
MNIKPKILIVDDEPDICEILSFNLSNEGLDVKTAYSAEEALELVTPDLSLILLDIMMEGMSGYKMAEKLRNEGNQIPIIFLTAKRTENDMLTGFSVGADDYIAKPFSVKEVIARIKALLKRSESITKKEKTATSLEFDSLVIDLASKELFIDKELINLTKTEFEILALLANNPTRIFSREDIINVVWVETPYITERTVDVHITRLRKKMKEHASLITSRSGYGYRFNISDE